MAEQTTDRSNNPNEGKTIDHTQVHAARMTTIGVVAAAIVTGMVTIVVALINKPPEKITNVPSPPSVQAPSSSIASLPSATPGPNASNDNEAELQELRKRNDVTLIQPDENELSLKDMPKQAFAYINAGDLDRKDAKIQVKKTYEMYEIHKKADNSVSLLGYASEETVGRIRRKETKGVKMSLYSGPWKTAPVLIELPLKDIKISGSYRNVPIDDNKNVVVVDFHL